MDIYQIWTTYNKPWSRREIAAFSVILIFTIIGILFGLSKKKIHTIQAVAILAMVVFLGIVFASTVFTRTVSVRQYELVPLWSWKAIMRYHDRELLKEDFLNCILLFPAGMLLPVIVDRKVNWYWAWAFGVMISAGIEVSQLLFMRGLFEWDDMIHNGLGCMFGCMITQKIREWMNKKK